MVGPGVETLGVCLVLGLDVVFFCFWGLWELGSEGEVVGGVGISTVSGPCWVIFGLARLDTVFEEVAFLKRVVFGRMVEAGVRVRFLR